MMGKTHSLLGAEMFLAIGLLQHLPQNHLYWGMGVASLFAFLLYLWGIETRYKQLYLHLEHRFLLYLWGIETLIYNRKSMLKLRFLLYLWGIETAFLKYFSKKSVLVFTLPMRNWNAPAPEPAPAPAPGFYFTYEELKQMWELQALL